MKEAELRQHTECLICDRKIGQFSAPVFNIVRMERFIVNMSAIQRQQGLAMQLGGNGVLAQIMGPDEDMAVPVGKYKAMICDDCLLKKMPEIYESADDE